MNSQKYPLPSWAKGYRITLMIFDAVIFLNFLVFLVFAITPGSFTTSNPNKAIPWLFVFAMLFLIAAVIPYLLANIVYGILWLTKLRGKGYFVSTISSVLIIGMPALVTVVLLMIWLPIVAAGK
jgi:hypothetical protein